MLPAGLGWVWIVECMAAGGRSPVASGTLPVARIRHVGAGPADRGDFGSEAELPERRTSPSQAMDMASDGAASLSLRLSGIGPAPALIGRRTSGETERRVLVVAPEPFYEDRGTPIAVRSTPAENATHGWNVRPARAHGTSRPIPA